MQQVFSVINSMLQKNKESRIRQLSISTYKVVPLGPREGVIEWISNVISYQNYLVEGTHSAHERYHPNEKKHSLIRARLQEFVNKNIEERRLAFREECLEFTPVFHNFFLENYLETQEWFFNRLRYTRSVAVASIAGWIIGLGDRHAQNILVDRRTGSILHIDLGISFEQGLILKIPEVVPFRLTRDVVDGMGVLGVEGTFRRSCEAALTVCRSGKDSLLSVVSVLLDDPLYNWGEIDRALQLKEQRNQNARTTNNGEAPFVSSTVYQNNSPLNDAQQNYQPSRDAEQVFLRVRDKLNGVSGKEVMDVEEQVSDLIKEAVNADNLALMFPGFVFLFLFYPSFHSLTFCRWSPWL